jgi:hypothetical protein
LFWFGNHDFTLICGYLIFSTRKCDGDTQSSMGR